MPSGVEVNWIRTGVAEPQGASEIFQPSQLRLGEVPAAELRVGVERLGVASGVTPYMRGARCRSENSGLSPSSHLSQAYLVTSAATAAANVQGPAIPPPEVFSERLSPERNVRVKLPGGRQLVDTLPSTRPAKDIRHLSTLPGEFLHNHRSTILASPGFSGYDPSRTARDPTSGAPATSEVYTTCRSPQTLCPPSVDSRSPSACAHARDPPGSRGSSNG